MTQPDQASGAAAGPRVGVLVGDGRGPRCELDRKCAPGEGKPGEGAVEDAFLPAAGFAHTTGPTR